MTILNLTQHAATPEQVAAGVVEPNNADKAAIKTALTFNALPSDGEMHGRAAAIVAIAKRGGATQVMVGGAPFFLPWLESALLGEGIVPLHAFSRRVSVETVQPDGSTRKESVFRHEGFIPSAAIAVRRALQIGG